MNEDTARELSTKLNALIAISLRQLLGQKGLNAKLTRRDNLGDIVRFLRDAGMDAKDIAAIVGSPVTSVRTLLTPKRRK